MRNVPALHSRMELIATALADPHISQDTLDHYYAELREINAQLSSEDHERRKQIVTFSNGLALPTSEIARRCAETSLADFCIWAGLSRSEVLERTGLGRAGVS